jgi:hypothetical protein
LGRESEREREKEKNQSVMAVAGALCVGGEEIERERGREGQPGTNVPPKPREGGREGERGGVLRGEGRESLVSA